MPDRKHWGDYAWDVLLFVGMLSAGAYVAQNVLSSLSRTLADPEREKQEQARERAEAHLRRLERGAQKRKLEQDGVAVNDAEESASSSRGPRIEGLALNEYESQIAMEVIAPEDIHVGFDDIGGLESIIEELKESVIYPLTMPHIYSHAAPLLSAPSGVLLYGPPGCGKTMLAKAVAHESGANFINLHISTLTEKWYGDSNKLVRAVFSLARKMQPAIIFIDEIDAVMGTRRSGEHEATGMVKAEFMALWDGLTSATASGMPARIVVLGATNRIHDIDEAILRRMPKKFAVPLPGRDQRRRILDLVLQDTKRDADGLDLDYIADLTAGMSGSDIKEACRDAAMAPVREYMREQRASGSTTSKNNPPQFRGIRTEDFFGRQGGQFSLETRAKPPGSAGKRKSARTSAARREDVVEGVVEPVD